MRSEQICVPRAISCVLFSKSGLQIPFLYYLTKSLIALQPSKPSLNAQPSFRLKFILMFRTPLPVRHYRTTASVAELFTHKIVRNIYTPSES